MEMDPPVVMMPTIGADGVPWLMWLPPAMSENKPTIPVQFDGLRVVAFHYFRRWKELNKWIDLMDKLAWEYAGRIKFGAQDIQTIKTFHGSLDPDDFGSFRADVPPRLYGMDNDGCIYTMHMFFSYKYIKDFCEKLLQGKMFEAVVINPIQELDLPPQNYYHLEDQHSKDFFVMLYDLSSYYWTLQLRKLRKLAKLLVDEDVNVVIVNRGQNYLGVVFDKWSKLSSLHGATTFASKRPDGWRLSRCSPQDSTRGYLRHIAKHRNPELKEYDSEGELRYPELALGDIKYLFEIK